MDQKQQQPRNPLYASVVLFLFVHILLIKYIYISKLLQTKISAGMISKHLLVYILAENNKN